MGEDFPLNLARKVTAHLWRGHKKLRGILLLIGQCGAKNKVESGSAL